MVAEIPVAELVHGCPTYTRDAEESPEAKRLREMDLKKVPSISETLDWARALLALNASKLDDEVVNQTLNVILKYEGDVRKAQGELSKLLEKKAGGLPAEPPDTAASSAGAVKKGALH